MRRRTREELKQLAKRILEVHARDDLSPTELATRFGCTAVFVREVLKRAGVYVPAQTGVHIWRP